MALFSPPQSQHRVEFSGVLGKHRPLCGRLPAEGHPEITGAMVLLFGLPEKLLSVGLVVNLPAPCVSL